MFERRRREARTRQLAAAGVRNTADAEYRQQRITQFAGLIADPDQVAHVIARLDCWHILETSGGYVAHPLWEDEPMLTRDVHPTRDGAIAEVHAVGGTLLNDAMEAQ